MASKALISFFFMLFSIVHQGFSDGLDQLLGGLGKIAAIKEEAQCMQKLVPCKPYLKSQINIPPACCVPLSEMATNDTKCVCSFFNNQEKLDSMSISKDDMLKLPNACSVAIDVNKCNIGASSSSTGINIDAATIFTPPADSTSSASSTKMITPYGIIHFAVSNFVSLLTALV